MGGDVLACVDYFPGGRVVKLYYLTFRRDMVAPQVTLFVEYRPNVVYTELKRAGLYVAYVREGCGRQSKPSKRS